MNNTPTGLLVNIYTNPDFHGCANGGVSTTHTTALLLDEKHPHLGPFGVKSDRPTLRVVRRIIAGKEYVHAEPVPSGDARPWFMAGGAFVYSCDSRFRELVNAYPISLHDRVE